MFELNRCPELGQPLPGKDTSAFGPPAVADAVHLMHLHPAYLPTPVQEMPALAQRLGLERIWVKDEAGRFGLGSFKALGGAYAVIRVALAELERQLGREVVPQQLLEPEMRARLRHLKFGCATDGNHGKSVAAGANLLGLRAQIFVHEGVSTQRVQAIARHGAEIVVVPGNYDDAVNFAVRECAANGWIVVSDTSWEGYDEIPRMVMQGYTTMVHELALQLQEQPTHVFLQAGVGGFAAAVAASMTLAGASGVKFVVVEPERAACLLESARVGACVAVPAQAATVMSMLECYRPSDIAWGVLSRLACCFMTVDDEGALHAMQTLEREGASVELISSESGAAGAAGLLKACGNAATREALKLGKESKVLLFNTERSIGSLSDHEHVATPAAQTSPQQSRQN